MAFEIKDGYDIFFKKFNISDNDFVEFGINECISVDFDTAEREWLLLKSNIANSKEVYIRGFGRNSSGSDSYIDFYKFAIPNINLKIDPSNNSAPRKLIEKLTGLKKNIHIQNYQVSHVFSKTKNVYAFTAPWNLIYLPKVFDPFTGHEAHGGKVTLFTSNIEKHIFNKFAQLIDDFNQTMDSLEIENKFSQFTSSIALPEKNYLNLKSSIQSEFSKITII